MQNIHPYALYDNNSQVFPSSYVLDLKSHKMSLSTCPWQKPTKFSSPNHLQMNICTILSYAHKKKIFNLCIEPINIFACWFTKASQYFLTLAKSSRSRLRSYSNTNCNGLLHILFSSPTLWIYQKNVHQNLCHLVLYMTPTT